MRVKPGRKKIKRNPHTITINSNIFYSSQSQLKYPYLKIWAMLQITFIAFKRLPQTKISGRGYE
jgi:hypothetical protein